MLWPNMPCAACADTVSNYYFYFTAAMDACIVQDSAAE